MPIEVAKNLHSSNNFNLTLNRSSQSVIRGKVDLGEIVSILEHLGYGCEVLGSLRGISGVCHAFDIVARGNATRIVIEFLLPGEDENYSFKTIAFRTKSYDCSPDLAVIVCPTKASDELKHLSEFYRFAMIESSDTTEVCKRLEKLMKEYLQ